MSSSPDNSTKAVAGVSAAEIAAVEKKVVFDDPHAGVGGLQEADPHSSPKFIPCDRVNRRVGHSYRLWAFQPRSLPKL